MDIRALQYFAAIASAGSFSRAADEVCISQPALSLAIKSLEAELKCPLFHRGRTISLTPEGERLQAHCRNLFHFLDDVREELTTVREGVGGTVRASLLESVLIYVLPELVLKFSHLYPRVQFQFSKSDSNTVEKSVLDDEAHFGITSRPPTSRDLEEFRLTAFPHVLVANRSMKGKLESLIKRFPLFLLSQSQVSFLQKPGQLLNRFPETKVVLPINCVAVVRQFVVKGLGIGLLPGYIIGNDLRVLGKIPGLEMPIFLIRKRTRRLFRASENFMNFILNRWKP